ncbi:hypothetical protein ACQ9LF_08835 [Anaerohalosphaeraceae bacterium U12dextr]
MAKLTPVWQLLENRNDKTAVLAEWKQRVGDSFRVVSPLLSPTGQYACAYPHPKPYGLKLSIVKHKNGDVVAVCPEDSDIRIPLTKTDIALYCLNMGKMRQTIAEALSLTPARDVITDVSDYILLGKYKPKPAAEFSVYMIISKPYSFITNVKDLCQSTRPFILLSTSMKDCTEEARDLIERKSSIMVSLDDVLEYSDSGMQCTSQWQQCLSVFAQKVNPTGRSNFSNKPNGKSAKRAADAAKIRKELQRWLKEQYKLITAAYKDEEEPASPPKITKTLLGAILNLKPYEVNRAFEFDSDLKKMLTATGTVDSILRYVEKRGPL